jgi:hypothetical protein
MFIWIEHMAVLEMLSLTIRILLVTHVTLLIC